MPLASEEASVTGPPGTGVKGEALREPLSLLIGDLGASQRQCPAPPQPPVSPVSLQCHDYMGRSSRGPETHLFIVPPLP